MKQKITTQGIAGHESVTWTKICVKGGTEESAEIPQFVSTLGLGLPMDTSLMFDCIQVMLLPLMLCIGSPS